MFLNQESKRHCKLKERANFNIVILDENAGRPLPVLKYKTNYLVVCSPGIVIIIIDFHADETIV